MVQNSSIYHRIPLIAQPDQTTCWAASTAMLLGKTVVQIQGSTPSSLLLSDGSLRNYSGAQDWVTGTQAFAHAHKLKYAAPRSWTVDALHAQLSLGPMIFDMLWNTTNYVHGNASPGHMILIVGISGEGESTTLTFNDPWPPRRGAITTVNYSDWIRDVPTRTYRVFWK